MPRMWNAIAEPTGIIIMNSDKETSEGLTCVDCDYELRGLPSSNPCPECGRCVRESILAQRNPNLFRYEDRLLKRESMYRKYRTGALVLAIVQLLGMIGLVY